MVISEEVKGIYNSKKDSAEKKRMTSFELTLEEFARFWTARDKFVCAYTGKPFVTKAGKDHAQFPTIDRIDHKGPYSRGNILWVGLDPHEVKTRYIENGESLPQGAVTLIKHKHRIEKCLKYGYDQMMKPYQEMWAELDKELEEEALHQKKIDEGKQKVEKDIILTQMFLEYSRDVKNAGGDFLITYSDFKKELTKKTCALSGVELPDGLPSRTLWVVNPLKDVTIDNVMVMANDTQKALDHLRGSCKMGSKELALLGKGLINLGE
ncbi:hypothetical protein NVP1170O_066 [Vibrio phage 1.170.O._10N.261.52.C3]|nr:hypothetical protein NVP1170O_066 [Vibrio phage 1.170.O._10N.261.52.C3]